MILALLQDGEATSALARAAAPWSRLYSHNKAVSAAVLFMHLIPLMTAAGTAFVADRATLRAVRLGAAERVAQLADLARIHRVVVGSLALSFVSGVALFLSDVDTFLASPAFWSKLVMVGLLLANGFIMTRTEASLRGRGDDAAGWSRMRTVSVLSMILWVATILNGVVLVTYA